MEALLVADRPPSDRLPRPRSAASTTRKSSRLESAGETAGLPLKQPSSRCLLSARDAQSSKHPQRYVLVDGGVAYATNATARPEALRRSLSRPERFVAGDCKGDKAGRPAQGRIGTAATIAFAHRAVAVRPASPLLSHFRGHKRAFSYQQAGEVRPRRTGALLEPPPPPIDAVLTARDG